MSGSAYRPPRTRPTPVCRGSSGARDVADVFLTCGDVPERPRPKRATVRGPGPLLGQHVVRDDGFGVGDAEVLGPLVGHRQETPYAPGNGVLGHRRVGALAELLQRRLAVLEPQPAGQ